jgi:PAS domain S-box
MKILTIIILFLIPLSAIFGGESPKKDNSAINNVDILLDLASKVYMNKPEKSLQYAETALKISKEKKDSISMAKAFKIIGDVYKRMDFERLSLPYYSKALEITSRNDKPELEAELNLLIGDIHYLGFRNDSAKTFFQNALTIYQKLNNKNGIAQSWDKLGNTYWFSTNYDKALDCYLKALSIYENTNYKPGIAKCYYHIGSLYTVLEDNTKAIGFLEKSLKFYTDYSDLETLSELYYRLGYAHQEQKRFDLAINFYKMARSIYDSLKTERKSAKIDRSIAKIYFDQGNIVQAISLAEKSLNTFEKYDYTWGRIEASNDLGKYYIHEEEYDKAKTYLNQALKLATKFKSWELLKSTYLELSHLYDAKNDYKKSLYYYKRFQVVNDSVQNREKTARFTELQAKYEANKKEQELQQKNQEISKSNELIKRQKINLYLFGAGIVIILILSFALYSQYRMLEVRGKKIERINSELDQRIKERTSALRLTQFSIEQAADPIFWMDKMGRFVYVNNSACNTLSYSKSELLRHKITDIIPKFTLSDWSDFWDISKKEGSLVVETQFQSKTQTKFPVELILNFINHEGKEYCFAFVRDISDRKQKEENLRKAKEKAEEADKLKSAFLANMSHEIRTPMNAIIGFSDMLVQEGFSTEEKQEFAGIVRSSGETLLKLIDDIINISLIEAGQLKVNIAKYNLNSLLKETHLSFQNEKVRLNKNHIDIKLIQNNFDDSIYIETDKVRFQQILTNLIGNALKFTESGSIEIGYNVLTKSTISIFVNDTGIGIPKDKIQQIFERFNKLHSDKKLYAGTGLGLTISKRLAELMGGELTVESDLGKGSKFKLTVEYILENPKKKEVLPKAEKSKVKQLKWESKSVLIVEDIESNYQFLETTLKKTGIKIHWVKNGIDALDYCQKVNPDIILMDIQLPGKNGYEVTREILEHFPQLPIIAQTAYAFNDEKEKILEAGCVAYITKPINTETLFETMDKHLAVTF